MHAQGAPDWNKMFPSVSGASGMHFIRKTYQKPIKILQNLPKSSKSIEILQNPPKSNENQDFAWKTWFFKFGAPPSIPKHFLASQATPTGFCHHRHDNWTLLARKKTCLVTGGSKFRQGGWGGRRGEVSRKSSKKHEKLRKNMKNHQNEAFFQLSPPSQNPPKSEKKIIKIKI